MKTVIYTFLLCLAATLLPAQIWDSQNIEFALPSQGWRIKPVDNKTAWTFGFTITEDPFEAWAFTDSEFTCQRTVNGGESWEELDFKTLEPGSGYICDVEGVSDKIAYISYYNYDEGPLLYKTKNGGQSWQVDNAGMTYFLNWVHFYDANNGIAFGDPGDDGFFEISYTTNGGNSWTLIDSDKSIEKAFDDEYGVYGDFTVGGSYIYTRSDYDRIFYPKDRGRSWQEAATLSFENAALWGLAANDQGALYAAYNTENTNAFKIYKRDPLTGDWTNVSPSDTTGYLAGMSAIPGTNTLLINKHFDFADDQTFVTLASTDGGANWLEVSKNQGFRTGFTSFYNASVGYACEIPGDFDSPTDNVFVYNGSPLTGLLSQNILSGKMNLFPNPATDRIHLNFDAEEVNEYIIFIHDNHGKLMLRKDLASSKGVHETIPINPLPSGEYVVTLSNKKGFRSMAFVKP